MDPVGVHAAVESAFNDGDVDALMDLYEPDARMVRDDGTVAVGLDEIRTVWSDLVALGGGASAWWRATPSSRVMSRC